MFLFTYAGFTARCGFLEARVNRMFVPNSKFERAKALLNHVPTNQDAPKIRTLESDISNNLTFETSIHSLKSFSSMFNFY